MIGFLQRVRHAKVWVDETCIAAIGPGLLVLVGVRSGDTSANARRLAERLLGYRVFPDAAGRMNRSLVETGGGLLLVPQFTLAADTRRGMRPGFSTAAPPEAARALFDALVEQVREHGQRPALGRFGADMAVELVNDGPVSFWLEG